VVVFAVSLFTGNNTGFFTKTCVISPLSANKGCSLTMFVRKQPLFSKHYLRPAEPVRII